MSSNLKIVRIRDFIRFNPEGDWDFEKMKECLREISSIPGTFTDHDVLIDTRGAETHLSVFNIWEIAKDFATEVQSGPAKGFITKIAVICPVKEFDNAKFFELCSLNRGLNVRAFTSFEDLFEWVSETSIPD